jgi:hypothetical protein
MRTCRFAAAAQQLIKHAAVKRPGPVFVGIGQDGALGRVRQPQVPQLALAGGQAAANLAQGLRSSLMTEQHGHELAPTTEPAGVALGPVFNDGTLNSVRENNCNIWLKMLDTRITAALVLPMVHVSQRKP